MLLKNWVITPNAAYVVIPDFLKVDFDNLPQETELVMDWMQTIASWFLIGVGLMLVLMGFVVFDIEGLFVGFGVGGLVLGYGVYRLYKSFQYSRRIIYLPEEVRVRFGRNKVSIVPYEEFSHIRLSLIASQWDRTVHVHQVCELIHPVKRLTVPFFITSIDDNVEPLMRDVATRFDLPIWRKIPRGYAVQYSKDLDRTMADKVFAKEVPVVSSLSAPPPGIDVLSNTEDGQETITLRVAKTSKAYWIQRIIFMILATGAAIWLLWFDKVLGIASLVFSIPFWIILAVTSFRKYEEIEFSSGELSGHGNQNSIVEDDVRTWRVPLINITEMLLHNGRSGMKGLTLICGEETYRIAQLASAKGRKWLRDFILYYMKERYVPEVEAANTDARSSSEGANQ